MKWWRRMLRRDPFFFGLTILFLGFAFVVTGVTWVNFRDWPLLIALATFAALTVLVFWLRSGGNGDDKRR